MSNTANQKSFLPLRYLQKPLHSRTTFPRPKVHKPRPSVASTFHQACVVEQVLPGGQERVCAVTGTIYRRSV